jgi:hypothetical protein
VRHARDLAVAGLASSVAHEPPPALTSEAGVPALAPLHTAQVISYLKATGLTLGLLVNFGERQLRTGLRRVVFTP